MKQIEIKNAGPVNYIKIVLPEQGGVNVLRGKNGAGKTEVLKAVSAYAGSKEHVKITDGAQRAEVSGLGAIVKFGKRTVRSGELEVESLESKFSLAELVDPKIDNPVAADAARIKALIQLTGASVEPTVFYPILSSQAEFDEYVAPESLQTNDPVAMAAHIKRDLEKVARHIEEQYKKDFAKAEAARLAVEGIDTSLPDSEEDLGAIYQLAVRTETRLQAEAKAYTEAVTRNDESKTALQRVQRDYQGLSVENATASLVDSITAVQFAEKKVADLKKELADAEQALTSQKHSQAITQKNVELAQAHAQTVEELTTIINSKLPAEVSAEDLLDASLGVKNALEAVQTGQRVRTAKDQIKTAENLRKDALELQEKSSHLRDAAKSTDMVLSSLVEKLDSPLRVSNSRLVLTTDRDDNELFDDLSDGEKWKLVVEIGIKSVGKNGIIPLPQSAWQDLDPINKRIVHETVFGTGVNIITAECSADPEITSEEFEHYSLA